MRLGSPPSCLRAVVSQLSLTHWPQGSRNVRETGASISSICCFLPLPLCIHSLGIISMNKVTACAGPFSSFRFSVFQIEGLEPHVQIHVNRVCNHGGSSIPDCPRRTTVSSKRSRFTKCQTEGLEYMGVMCRIIVTQTCYSGNVWMHAIIQSPRVWKKLHVRRRHA